MNKAQRHELISYIKSIIRLVGYMFIWPLSPLVSIILFISELLGIAEEVWGA